MNSSRVARLEELLGARIKTVRPVSGGDICAAYRLIDENERDLFVKTRADAPPKMFEAEAFGLRWLTETATLRTPLVVDLAMMRLFGGFSSRVFLEYEKSYPLLPGAELRVYLYQLYPLLVHLNLFGSGYAASVKACLKRLL